MSDAVFLAGGSGTATVSTVLNAKKLRWLSVLVAAGLTLISAVDAKGFRRYFRLRREMQTLTEKNAQLAIDNANLTKQIEALRKDPRALERAAREELGFVKPGEIVLVAE
jgi:cell division protein FtsB